MITAPFNFVPLSEKVFFPDWADEVSHDVPFEDSQSGMIEISMTAKSPIFVRDHKDEEEFCHHNGVQYIPGSSVKGMIRNVLEIMSFSKMSQLDDDTYAVRDLSKSDNFYMSQMNQHNHRTYCGWLKKVDNEYFIEDCGIPGRVHNKQIDYALNVDFSKHFKSGKFNAKDNNQKTSEYKYNLVGNKIHMISLGEKYKSEKNAKYDLREFYKFDKNSKNRASLILTGQPTPRKDNGKIGDGKGFEFLFFDIKSELEVDQKVFEDFKFAYFDERKTEPKESPDWTYWKKKLENGDKVPVFFQKNGKEVAHFGLSYLYKLPYAHSVKDGMPPLHKDDSRKDLAQTMFGYISNDEALKGRVQFSHFKAVEHAETLDKRTEILGTPRASYYPIYVKQQEGNLFSTFMEGDFAIAGWKRYPIHKGSGVQKTTQTGNENVGTTFRPLKDGVVFNGKVRYHNLKKAELGALLSALTFHGTDRCFHNIGMAKALGYGKIALKLSGIEDIETYLKAFEVELSEQVENWSESEQLKELLSMATEQENNGNSKLKYMELEQFAKNKTGDKDYLRNYTALQNIQSIPPISLVSEEDLEELRVKQAQRKEQERLRQEQRKRDEAHKKEWEIVYASTNLNTIEAFVKKYPDSKYLDTAHKKIEAIKKEVEKLKLLEGKKEAIEKWKKIHHPSNTNYLKDALTQFIEDYPNSSKVEEAKQELQSLISNENSKVKTMKGSAFENATTIGHLKSLVNSNKNTEENKQSLEETIIRIYAEIKKNKRKKYIKELQNKGKMIIDWLGEDRFNEIIKELDR